MLRVAAILILCLAGLAGCAHSGGVGGTRSDGPIQAERPPSDYVVVGSAAGGNIGTSIESGDLALSLYFGLTFVRVAGDAKPSHPGTAGAGTSARDPIVFDPPVGSNEELDTALSWLAGRYPDRSHLKGWLLRSPDTAGAQKYLLYVELTNAGAANALYIDITRWAEMHRKMGS